MMSMRLRLVRLLATHGRQFLAHLVLGSVAERVVRGSGGAGAYGQSSSSGIHEVAPDGCAWGRGVTTPTDPRDWTMSFIHRRSVRIPRVLEAGGRICSSVLAC